MAGKNRSSDSLSLAQIRNFRLERHYLLACSAATLTGICGSVCGVQAQVMACAEMALWTRLRCLTRAQIHAALFQDRTLVKTSLMRQTLHLIPSADFHVYIAALKRSRLEAVLRVMSRFRITREEAAGINEIVVRTLRDGPLTQGELRKAIRPRVSRRVRTWMDRVSSVLRTALAEGLVCYGPQQGKKVTYVLVEHWLGKQEKLTEDEAKRILLRRYLSAYGPATLADFSHWSGISVREAGPVWQFIENEFAQVSFGNKSAFLLRQDERHIGNATPGKPVVRLLPAFDPFLLGHAQKDHLVESIHYKRVYRNQGWISPVLLSDGLVVGIWSMTRRKGEQILEAELFEKPTKALRGGLEEEAAGLGAFLGASCQVKVAR